FRIVTGTTTPHCRPFDVASNRGPAEDASGGARHPHERYRMTTAAVIPDAPARSDPNRFRVLAIVAMAQLMIVLDASVVTIALPSAQRALNISVGDRQWVLT